MDKHSCACKGIRTCLLCENNKTMSAKQNGNVTRTVYTYCSKCEVAWPASSSHSFHACDAASSGITRLEGANAGIAFPGIHLIPEFVTEAEEEATIIEMDSTPFNLSQSGRRKQDYGPKVNFKKRKVKSTVFTGLPRYSEFIYKRMIDHHCLNDFFPVELCNLEYTPERGSAIDPHFDDFWLWGERLVTLNLLSNTILTFTKPEIPEMVELPDIEIQVPLCRRSLIVVSGLPRTHWLHGIQRQDITSRRIAMTFREFSPEFMNGGSQADLGNNLIKTALRFQGSVVGFKTEM